MPRSAPAAASEHAPLGLDIVMTTPSSEPLSLFGDTVPSMMLMTRFSYVASAAAATTTAATPRAVTPEAQAEGEAEACGAGAPGSAGAANETVLVAAAALVAATLVRGEFTSAAFRSLRTDYPEAIDPFGNDSARQESDKVSTDAA